MWEFNLRLDENETIKELGLEDNGIVQQKVDSAFIHYMRLKMPFDTGMMISNTFAVRPGEVLVNVPYAHYMNEGIKYVMANGKSAYYSPEYGFWSDKGKKKMPTSQYLTYHSGPGRGAFFVQRTILENTDDIVKVEQRGVK